ncbi:hypothetical protein [Nocardioides panzhihuensis]|uniref:Uncharacterized protein n=1 Tax=Nocardioides panzhihuensis TaxID=860243 RepID=A0A7Z0DNH7_9ACTN|nr:hypothetical protein [Nocardioides panzhihuensis]NYI78743.1 hypothetical protein [Nocardioides panzhihuensis]
MTARREKPWARHYQHIWHERAADSRFPLWARVAWLAYGSHRANGHANYKAGEIALVFSRVNTATGEVRPEDKHNIQRAIKAAIASGWLSEGSSSLCLVVPAHAVAGGMGHPGEVCKIHERRAKRSIRQSKGGSTSDSL